MHSVLFPFPIFAYEARCLNNGSKLLGDLFRVVWDTHTNQTTNLILMIECKQFLFAILSYFISLTFFSNIILQTVVRQCLIQVNN